PISEVIPVALYADIANVPPHFAIPVDVIESEPKLAFRTDGLHVLRERETHPPGLEVEPMAIVEIDFYGLQARGQQCPVLQKVLPLSKRTPVTDANEVCHRL